jgi:ribosome-associated protein YbcJ (S4-like RNA binding protein)
MYASYNELEIKDGEVLVNLVKTETGSKKVMAHYSVEVRDESLLIQSYTHNSIHQV